NGANGTLLLDPTDITIHSANPDSAGVGAALADSILTDAELAGAVTISQATLALLMGDIRLEASNNIIFNNSPPNFTLHPSATSLTLVADADNDGVGNVDMQLNALIDTNGADLTFIGENIVVRHIDAGTGKITLNARDRVTFNLSATISTQDLTIRSDRLTIPTGIFAPTITGTGNFALETETASRDIILGGSGTTPTALDITTNDLQTLQTGFTSTTIGRSDGTGTITISDADSLTASTHIAGAGNFVSADRDATWTLTGSNSGSVSGLTNNLTFSNVAKITGGSANDTFVFASGVNFNGNIDGGAGFDTLDYANYGESVTVDLIGGTATGTLGIANIENAILFVDNKLEATPIPVTLVETSGKIVIPYTILANNSPLPSLITDADLPRGSRNFSSADVALRTFDSKFSNAFRQYIASDSGGNAANISEKGVNDNLNSSDPDPFDRSSEDSNSENSEEARKQEITLARAQDSLNAVYLATGVKPALLYIIFVPPLGNAENAPESNRDRLMLLFVPPQGDAIVRPLPINRELAVKVAHRFRRRVTNKRRPTAFMTPAQKLYSWLIEPIAADLKAREIQHLTFLLDSQLRSLPIAALHNGENFLVEDYSLSVMPSLALTDLSYANVRNMSLLAMGAETFQDQKPLPAAGAEVEILTEQLWKGESYLNENFSVETLLEARQENAFPLIHLATHGQFTSGSPDNSFISLGNDKLSLSQIRKLGLHDPPVELLVLSACQTALGDVQAELGFAGLAVLAGVKSALGSLWKVDDTGTLLLMTTFYKQLKEAPIKAEALRRSQISMIRGETQLGDGEIVTTSGTISLDQKLTGGRDLSHPYFWSGFTLIGTPW
ncbi:MAG: CHAT domain-containing protein, partial [Spirulina sp.]